MKNEIQELNDVLSIGDINRIAEKFLSELRESKDPIKAYLLGELIQRFVPVLGRDAFMQWGIIPDAEHYQSWAFHVFYERANLKDASAARWVANYYMCGISPVDADSSKYREWLQIASELGDVEARHELASIGHGCPKNG